MAFTAACVQFCATRDIDRNIDLASDLIRQAAAAGATLIATPEVTSLMERNSARSLEICVTEGDDRALKAFRALAAELSLHLLVGSLPIKISDDQMANRSFMIGPDGGVITTYDKIHMFDVTLPDGESIRESKVYRPGEKAVVADLPFGKLGLTICYDLRFPALYQSLAAAGAQIMMVPAAFTRITGEAHWHTLITARAIETGSFVIAPGQCGDHEDGRKTYGHSLIVAPWGEVLADGGTEPGIITAEIDLDRVGEARSRLPVLQQTRNFTPA